LAGDTLTTLWNNLILSGPDLVDVFFSISLAAVIGALISQLYKNTHRGLNYEHTFMATLVLLAPIVTVVMLYIRGDLVLSLGLIGSLSIIRFRTPIKDTRDMVFLFWVIAVGLGSGTYNWGVVVLSSFFLMILVAILYYIRYGTSQNSDFVLVVSGNMPYEGDQPLNIIKRYTVDARVRSHEVTQDNWEIVYELRFQKLAERQDEKVIAELQALPGVQRVSLLAPQLALPL
jgi:hypothetical protein